jgi:uncharacterized protein (TIGR00369 family)
VTGSALGSGPAATAAREIWQEPVRGAAVYPGLAALSGVEQLQTFLTGQSPDPPAARLTGRRIVDASVGSATYSLPATDWILGPKGFVHSGALALLADGALVATVVSGLPARTLCTTAELLMTFLGTLPSGDGEITARGHLLHLDAQMGLAEVFVSDARDRLVAHGTSRCSVFPPIEESVDLVPPLRRLPRSDLESPDPYRRSVPPTHRERLRPDRDGLELLRARAHGDMPPPPIDEHRVHGARREGQLLARDSDGWPRAGADRNAAASRQAAGDRHRRGDARCRPCGRRARHHLPQSARTTGGKGRPGGAEDDAELQLVALGGCGDLVFGSY